MLACINYVNELFELKRLFSCQTLGMLYFRTFTWSLMLLFTLQLWSSYFLVWLNILLTWLWATHRNHAFDKFLVDPYAEVARCIPPIGLFSISGKMLWSCFLATLYGLLISLVLQNLRFPFLVGHIKGRASFLFPYFTVYLNHEVGERVEEKRKQIFGREKELIDWPDLDLYFSPSFLLYHCGIYLVLQFWSIIFRGSCHFLLFVSCF